MFEVKKLTRLHQDYLTSFLHSQLTALQSVLSNVEDSQKFDYEYLEESIKRVEQDMHRFRKVFID